MLKEPPNKEQKTQQSEIFYKETKKNIDGINDSLFNSIRNLEKENLTLKEAVEELNLDNREKQQALDDSHKILTKLNEEYTKLIREFETLEKYSNELEAQNTNAQKISDNAIKSNSLFEKIEKQNQNLINENEKFKKENQNLKSQISLKINENLKLEKELTEKSQILEECKSKFENIDKISEEKDKIISQFEQKIQDMNYSLQKKEEELKLLIKITQELGSENKSNVEELAKQAVNTIKVFYNTMNNNNNNLNNLNLSHDFSSTDSSIITNTHNKNKKSNSQKEEKNFFLSKKEIEKMLQEKKCSLILEEAITSPSVVADLKSQAPNQEILMNLNFKNELIKCELFASLIREMNFANYVNDLNLFKGKIDDNNKNNYKIISNSNEKKQKTKSQSESKTKFISDTKHRQAKQNNENEVYFDNSINGKILNELKEIFEKLKSSNEELNKENELLKNENLKLKENNHQLELLSFKLKENTNSFIQKMKERFESVEKSLTQNLNRTKSFYKEQIYNLEKKNKISENDLKVKNEEIKRLLKENENLNITIDKVIKENENLNITIDKVKKENENLNITIDKIKKENENFLNLDNLKKDKKKNSSKMNKSQCFSNYWKIESSTNIEIPAKSKSRTKIEKSQKISNLSDKNFTLACKEKDSLSSSVNNSHESYIEKKYLQLKEENVNLKQEIQKLKTELENFNQPQEKKTESFCEQCLIINEKIRDFRVNVLKTSKFKELKQFYVMYQMDIDKLNTKIEEVAMTIKHTDNQFTAENSEKKIKASQIREILSGVQKLMTLLSIFFDKYNKDLNIFTQNLKTLFDFVSKIVYANANSFLNTFTGSEFSLNKSAKVKSENFLKIGDYTERILKMIYDLNYKAFSMSDLRKIYLSYENRSVSEILEIFKFNCEVVKNNVIEKNNFETEISEFEDEFAKFENRENHRNISLNSNLNNSFKTVNDRLLKLKKFEFDFSNLIEVIKNLLVVQEILSKILFSEENSNCYVTKDNENIRRNRMELLDKIFYITEETIFCRCGEFDENLFFIKKFSIGLMKNQKNILLMGLENR